MKKYLLFVIAFVCVSIGAWAAPHEGFDIKPHQIGTWTTGTPAEKVIKVEVMRSGGIAAALQVVTGVLNGSTGAPYDGLRNKLNEDIWINNNPYSDDFVANKRLILKFVFAPEANDPQTLTLSDDDIAALGAIDIPTIDLQDLELSAFTFTNSNVKNVILPDGWTKEEVKAAGQALTSSNAVISFEEMEQVTVVI